MEKPTEGSIHRSSGSAQKAPSLGGGSEKQLARGPRVAVTGTAKNEQDVPGSREDYC